MKKGLILCLALMMAFAMVATAKPYAIKKQRVLIDNPNEAVTSVPYIPSQKIVTTGAKFAGTLIDSSRNVFGICANATTPIRIFNDSLAFAFRQFPTASGIIACASSGDFGASWNIDYNLNADFPTCRYPSAVSGPSPSVTASRLSKSSDWIAGHGAYCIGGWLNATWDPSFDIIPEAAGFEIWTFDGVYLDNGDFFGIGNGNSVSKVMYSGDLTTELMAPEEIWNTAVGDTAWAINVDYRLGRLIQMSWGITGGSELQYVMSDDNGATGFTGADTIGFPIVGMNDSILWEARMVVNNDKLPVVLLAVTGIADTIDDAWSGCYLYNSIICALPTGEHYTIYDAAGSPKTGEGVGSALGFTRGEGDTLIATWMVCNDLTGYETGIANWDLMSALSPDGGHTWRTPVTIVNTPIAECFPHAAVTIGSDRKVHIIYGTTNSTTVNKDMYWDCMISLGVYTTTWNYWVAVSLDALTGVEGNAPSTPVYKLALNQSAPNPARNAASISFSLPKSGNYSLKIYNIAGQVIRTLDSKGIAGQNTVTWNGLDNSGRQVANGVYLYNLNAFGNSATKKLVVVR